MAHDRTSQDSHGLRNCMFPNGTVAVFCGFNTTAEGIFGLSGYQQSIEIRDYSTGLWRFGGMCIVERTEATVTMLADGRAFFVGGNVRTGTSLNTTEILDLASVPLTPASDIFDGAVGTCSATGRQATSRGQAQAVALPGGDALVGIGMGPGGPGRTFERYHAGTWALAPLPIRTRTGAPLLALANGDIMCSGGYGDETYPQNPAGEPPCTASTVEILRVNSSIWHMCAGTLFTPRFWHGAALLTKGPYAGCVLIIGGMKKGRLSYDPTKFTPEHYEFDTWSLTTTLTCEIYDPANEVSIATGSISTARVQPMVSTCADGRVLIVGGFAQQDTNGAMAAGAEIYDPITGTWTSHNPTTTSVVGTLTALRDNRQLLVGGHGGSGNGYTPTARSELFHVT